MVREKWSVRFGLLLGALDIASATSTAESNSRESVWMHVGIIVILALVINIVFVAVRLICKQLAKSAKKHNLAQRLKTLKTLRSFGSNASQEPEPLASNKDNEINEDDTCADVRINIVPADAQVQETDDDKIPSLSVSLCLCEPSLLQPPSPNGSEADGSPTAEESSKQSSASKNKKKTQGSSSAKQATQMKKTSVVKKEKKAKTERSDEKPTSDETT